VSQITKHCTSKENTQTKPSSCCLDASTAVAQSSKRAGTIEVTGMRASEAQRQSVSNVW